MRAASATLAAVALLAPSYARADDADSPFGPPPMPPFKAGPFVEGSVGVYGPTGRLKQVSAPGTWARLGLGWDFKQWIGAYAMGDVAFLDTSRASPPPDPRSYTLWGFGLGARLSIGITGRVRIPLRAEVSFHKTDDTGVLATYGFSDYDKLSVSIGGFTGVEWRALNRHFGVSAEVGLRNDSGLEHNAKAQSPIAILGALLVRYTL